MPDNVMRAVENSDEAIADLADWEEDIAETAEKILSDEKDRFLLIPKRESREGYEIMVAFTASVRRKGLREKLSLPLTARAHSGGSGAS
jgi:FPC/CPF motif-containing protein YcgG